MADSNETIFAGTMFRIKELDGFSISPNGLGFLEPNSMFLEIGPVLVLVPLEFHIMTVFYSIYDSQLQRDRKRQGQATQVQNNRLSAGTGNHCFTKFMVHEKKVERYTISHKIGIIVCCRIRNLGSMLFVSLFG